MRRKILVADLLCGAGGSSTGCIQALLELGFALEDIILACVNHWQVAIDTHRRNHPTARHYVQDIATGRPHIIVPEGYLDLLIASPTCTHHSNARGGKPTSDQQRSDPWHIITWLTELRVKRLIIENVWEFIKWGPIDLRTGRPIKSREGEYFWAWISAIKALGFTQIEWRKLNAADYGDATTRQRFILMARSDSRRLVWPMPTHRKSTDDSGDLFSATMQPWRPAREIIDWSHKGRSIFRRKKPLAPKTLLRIYAGAMKFEWPAPLLLMLQQEIERSLVFHIQWAFSARNEPALAAKRKKRRALARKLIAQLLTFRASPGAVGGRATEPMVVTLRRNGNGSSIHQPIATVAASGTHIGLAQPIIVNMKGKSTASSSQEPLPTQTAHAPHLFTAEPFVLSQASCGAPRTVGEPIPTVTTGGNGSAHALITPYYGSGSGETCVTTGIPLPTITAKGRFGMVVPVTQSNGGARDVAEPLPTMTTAKGGEFAIVMPVTHHDHSGRTRDVGRDPVPTITGANRGELALVSCDPDAEFDILFRMLEPPELAAAMGFTSEDATYEFAGNKTEQIKQIGNAVSVRKMKACVAALMADSAPRRRAPAFLEAAE